MTTGDTVILSHVSEGGSSSMSRVENAMIRPAMAARHGFVLSTPSSSSVAAPLPTGSLLGAAVVVSFVSLISSLLLLMCPAVSQVERA